MDSNIQIGKITTDTTAIKLHNKISIMMYFCTMTQNSDEYAIGFFCVYVHKLSIIRKWNIGMAPKGSRQDQDGRQNAVTCTTQFPAHINQQHKPYIVTSHSHMIFFT